MHLLQWLSTDEYKQKVISKILVEGAILQFILSFVMIAVYLFTDMEPLFLLLIPFAVFLFYSLARYIFSGIEFANVFTADEVRAAKKRNLLSSIAFCVGMSLLSILMGRSMLDSVMVPLIAGILWFVMNSISLRKSVQKNADL
ncbi:hypothetical protein [Psychrobacillus sp. BL-248-WT-3]|uniref:hypothetical protein n=1 Tax=Psychrobacillus sp. BL-248-WT-3 TaxID=2725306 RepID=UPI00146CE909|nr:hypothetical protein [Psychrobacillus sp. BL-248-WT-3]NME06206.1 hypothetical protein [Psychrobacillus sp. BL-248-WT-3]